MIVQVPRLIAAAALVGSLAACAMRGESSPDEMERSSAPAAMMAPEEEAAFGGGMEDQDEEWGGARQQKSESKKKDAAMDDGIMDARAPAAAPPPVGALAAAPGRGGDAAPEAAPVRKWFPEAFLWAPRVVTDGTGEATLDLQVPDQLTTWRVLGMAHDREGHQAGATLTFDSALPLYVDPVVPGWLTVGDRVDVPIQLANATADAVTGSMDVQAGGALSGQGRAELSLGAGGSAVRWVRLEAVKAGGATISIKAETSGGTDALQRELRVNPSGRLVERVRGGTLSSNRDFVLLAPSDSDEKSRELVVQVHGGAMSVLLAEVERVALGGSADGVYAMALASRASSLGDKLGAPVPEARLKRLGTLAWQRVARGAMSPAPLHAAELVMGFSGPISNELALAARPRLVRTMLQAQRADGTWADRDGERLSAVLVRTSFMARALPSDELAARSRAAGALERHAPTVDDSYTASAMLATGLLDGDTASRMLELVKSGLVKDETGKVSLGGSSGVNAFGVSPSHTERLAFAVLALPDGSERSDLVAELLSRYHPVRGFASGSLDVVVMDALLAGLPALDGLVSVDVLVNGGSVGELTVDPSQPGVPSRLVVPVSGAETKVSLRSARPQAGLGFVTTLRSYVPVTKQAPPGVDLELKPVRPLVAGVDGAMQLTLAAPSSTALQVEIPLPPGVSIGEALGKGGPPAGFVEVERRTDALVLTTAPFQGGQILNLSIPVQSVFGGELHTPPLLISTVNRGRGADAVAMAAPVWTVAKP